MSSKFTHAHYGSSMKWNNSLLRIILFALIPGFSFAIGITQGLETIDLSRTGDAKAALLRLQREMRELELVNAQIEQLPNLSRNAKNYELIRRHANLLEDQTLHLLTVRRLATSSAGLLRAQLRSVDHLAEDSWTEGEPVTGTNHDRTLKQHYHQAFESLDAGRFQLQDGIVRLRLLAFAADRKVLQVRHVATSNRSALSRDYTAFQIQIGQEIQVNRSTHTIQ